MRAIVINAYGGPEVLELKEIDRTYAMHETREAFRYFEEKHARGKVVVENG